MNALYEQSKIGKKIAQGGDRSVFMYGTDEVIKFSSISFFLGKKFHEKLHRDYSIAKKYLGDYIVDTVDVSASVTTKHIEIQAFVKGDMLRKKHMQNLYVKSQLLEIVQAMNLMKNDKYATLDLVGNKGMTHPCLSNVMVDAYSKLRIVDTALLEGKSCMPFGLVLEILLPIIVARQNYLVQQFLK